MQRIAEQFQKQVNTERFLLEDSPKNKKKWEGREENSWSKQLRVAWSSAKNWQSKMSVLLFIHRSWISFCPCGRKLNLSEEMLPAKDKHFKQLVEDAYMTFRGSRRVKHGAQPWQKHHFLAKEFMRKSTKNEYIRRFLTASRIMKHFMQASYNISGRERSANIWITFEQSFLRTMPLRNNWNDTFRCILFGTIQNIWTKAPWKVVQTITKLRGPLSAWTKKQVRIHRFFQEETYVAMIWTLRISNGQYGSHTVGNGTSRRTDTQTQIPHKRHHQESEKEQASGNQEELTLTSDKWWNANWWSKSWWVVATAVCATGSVHTLSCRTHIFFACRTDIANTHGSRCLQCACGISPSRFLHSHVSPAILVVPARSHRHHVPVRTVFVELYSTHKRGSSALLHERRGVWLPRRSPRTPQVMSPQQPDKTTSVDGDTTPTTIRTTIASLTSRTLDCSVFPQCLKPMFRPFLWFCSSEWKTRKHASQNRCKTERKKRKRKFSDQCWKVGVEEKSTEQYQESFSSDEISENTLMEELNKLFLVKILFKENCTRLSTTLRFRT